MRFINFGEPEPPVNPADPETWPTYGALRYRLEGPHMFLFRAESSYTQEGGADFYFRVFRAVRFTPCGAWITEEPDYVPDPHLRWVDLQYTEGKKLAHVSKAAAARSLRARKSRQVSILSWQLEGAQAAWYALSGIDPSTKDTK